MNYSPPGSSVHRVLQARILEWVAMPSSRRSSWPRDRTQVSHLAGRFFTIWATGEALGIAQTKILLRKEMAAKLGVWAPVKTQEREARWDQLSENKPFSENHWYNAALLSWMAKTMAELGREPAGWAGSLASHLAEMRLICGGGNFKLNKSSQGWRFNPIKLWLIFLAHQEDHAQTWLQQALILKTPRTDRA